MTDSIQESINHLKSVADFVDNPKDEAGQRLANSIRNALAELDKHRKLLIAMRDLFIDCKHDDSVTPDYTYEIERIEIRLGITPPNED